MWGRNMPRPEYTRALNPVQRSTLGRPQIRASYQRPVRWGLGQGVNRRTPCRAGLGGVWAGPVRWDGGQRQDSDGRWAGLKPG
jgi:hypothetical protein